MTQYVIQKTERTRCAQCNSYVDLMCPEDVIERSDPMFYVCWHYQSVAQVGVGPVQREGVLV